MYHVLPEIYTTTTQAEVFVFLETADLRQKP